MPAMIRISITPAAFEAIAATLPVGSVSFERDVDANGERELVMARWGHAWPASVRRRAGHTNIRNVSSPHWRGWLGKRNRCIVPATSFCEYADTKPRKDTHLVRPRRG
jgi:putative SOS response-associated peptidase YedK